MIACEYDIKGMSEFIRDGGHGCYIDCSKGRAYEIADIMNGLGFRMGCWYEEKWTDPGWRRMFLSNGEVHMDGVTYLKKRTIKFEELLEMFRIVEEDPVDVDLSKLFE